MDAVEQKEPRSLVVTVRRIGATDSLPFAIRMELEIELSLKHGWQLVAVTPVNLNGTTVKVLLTFVR